MLLDKSIRARLNWDFANRWMGVRLDMIGAIIVSAAAYSVGTHVFTVDTKLNSYLSSNLLLYHYYQLRYYLKLILVPLFYIYCRLDFAFLFFFDLFFYLLICLPLDATSFCPTKSFFIFSLGSAHYLILFLWRSSWIDAIVRPEGENVHRKY